MGTAVVRDIQQLRPEPLADDVDQQGTQQRNDDNSDQENRHG
jgi:hypothetical protein